MQYLWRKFFKILFLAFGFCLCYLRAGALQRERRKIFLKCVDGMAEALLKSLAARQARGDKREGGRRLPFVGNYNSALDNARACGLFAHAGLPTIGNAKSQEIFVTVQSQIFLYKGSDCVILVLSRRKATTGRRFLMARNNHRPCPLVAVHRIYNFPLAFNQNLWAALRMRMVLISA
jgi:hypothetical protein